jgi:hypothetical protein
MISENFKGKHLKDYTFEVLMGLNRKQLIELFCRLDAPDMSEMRGEYRAAFLNCGNIINIFLGRLFLFFIWGAWQHKAFEPLGEKHGHGYNTFITTQPGLYENCFIAIFIKILNIVLSLFRWKYSMRMARIMLNKTSLVSSVFDGRPSFQLSYRDYNTFFTSTMTDEVRKVNDNLYLGIGRLTVTFGKYNPMPFALMGPPEPWVGPDIPYPER